MIYHATASAGGLIPERLLLRLMLGTLEGMFDELEKNASTVVPRHYTKEHPPHYGGNGKEIPRHQSSTP